MKSKVFLCLVWAMVCAFVPTFWAFAQRQTPGRPSIDGQVLFSNGFGGKAIAVGGGNITWNQYNYLGRWCAGLEVYTHPHDFVSQAVYEDYTTDGIAIPESLVKPEMSYQFRAYDVLVGGGYFIRALSSRSRSVILSVGLSTYIGVRYCDEMASFEKPESTVQKPVYYSKVGFIWNMIPEVQLEVFPFRNVSLFTSARPRFEIIDTMGGVKHWFRFSWGTGIKYYL